VFLVIATVLSSYFIYHSAKREGFLEEKMFDLIVYLAFIYIVFSKIGFIILNPVIYGYYNFKTILSVGFDTTIGFYVSLLFFHIFVKYIKKWSVKKVGDVLSKSFALFISVISLGLFSQNFEIKYLIFSVGFMIFFFFLNYLEVKELFGASSSRFRIKRLKPFAFLGVNYYIFLMFSFLAFGFLTYFSKEPLRILKLVLYFGSQSITILIIIKKIREGEINMALTKNWLNNLKKALIKEQKNIEQEELELSGEDPFLQKGRDVGNAEMGDEVTEVMGRRDADIQRDVYKRLKMAVSRSLARINLGTYGKCEVCGKSIPEERLKANPYATTCVECAKKS